MKREADLLRRMPASRCYFLSEEEDAEAGVAVGAAAGVEAGELSLLDFESLADFESVVGFESPLVLLLSLADLGLALP